ncbi:hypothetical protein [Anabaena catenula]|uniref:Uncharacterized protein n=1 Tax=Anabaena catenula FACHB-362 TaxID=2692877 RepID=A0ABR8J997_9NOST|nr:hypothetical protein [Anabaena catenula]MBD2694170.1 hypothetical protein [Anabaena catenula FACHB-362]
MNIQSVQESLNYLILVITAFSIIVMLIDFMVGLVHLWHQVAFNVEYCTTHKTSEQSNIEPIDTTNSNLNVEQENCHPSANDNSVVNSSANFEHNNCNQSNIHKYDDLTTVENTFSISTILKNDNGNQSNDSTSLQPEFEVNNSIAVDIEKIDLRTARKIASAIKKSTNPKSDLIIKQKVNGKNVPLAWLQAQIKNRLEIAPEIVKPIIQELAPNAIHDSDENIQPYHILQKGKPQRQVG